MCRCSILRDELVDLTLDLAGESRRTKYSRVQSTILYNIERLVVKGRLPERVQEPSIDTTQHPFVPSQVSSPSGMGRLSSLSSSSNQAELPSQIHSPSNLNSSASRL